MSVGAERLPVHKCLGDSIDGLVAVEAEKLGDDGGGCDLDEHDVVEADTVKRVEQRKTTLDFVGLDHALEDVMDGKWLSLAGEMISHGKDGAEVVRWMTPYQKEAGSVCGSWGIFGPQEVTHIRQPANSR